MQIRLKIRINTEAMLRNCNERGWRGPTVERRKIVIILASIVKEGGSQQLREKSVLSSSSSFGTQQSEPFNFYGGHYEKFKSFVYC